MEGTRHREGTSSIVEDATSRPKPKEKPANIPWSALPNKDQLFLLALCRLSEPMSNTCLLPYIYYLMRSIITMKGESDTNANARKISEYSGLLVAAFPLAQFATSMIWARLADSYGRRVTIVGALAVSVIANAAFGFSRSFGALMFWRILAGIANGNVGIMRTMTAEIVREKKYETKAFLLLPLIFNSGMVVGVALGGCLADPVINLPWLFGPTGVFNVFQNPQGVEWALSYPYALPALWNALMLGSAFLLAALWLKETLAGRENQLDVGLRQGRLVMRLVKRVILRGGDKGYAMLALDDFHDVSESLDEEQLLTDKPRIRLPKAPLQKIWTRDVITALISFALLPLHNSAFMHIFPVFLSNPPADNSNASTFSFNGGLGLSSPSIGLWLALLGVCGILLQLFIYPRMQARIGTLGNFRIALFIFPVTYTVAPYLARIAPMSPNETTPWLSIVIVAWSQIMARTLAIPSTVILLTDSAPAKNVLGTIHGAGNTLASLARAVGPAVGGWVFAWGIEHNMVGAVWWFYLLIIGFCALAWSYTMRPSS